MAKVWFITGASRGFGREFALTALARGDRVAATARNPETLAELSATYGGAVLPLALDVTDRAGVEAAVADTVERFGRIDVVVNNAGYGLFGMIEEITEQQLREQLEVNLFGPFHVTQAVLPIMRQQQSGHIVQISTVGGIAAYPNLGGYHASKWALEAMSESLAQEVAAFNIKVTLVEPGPYTTDWSGSSAIHAERKAPYEPLRAASAQASQKMPTTFRGDPKGVGPALLKVVDAQQPPLRVLFGLLPTKVVPSLYEQRLKTWEQWEAVAVEANGH